MCHGLKEERLLQIEIAELEYTSSYHQAGFRSITNAKCGVEEINKTGGGRSDSMRLQYSLRNFFQ
ncbi:hypothetical protein C492_16998 [Natronococcus jeotgali DSM 18795]|uniref:Uncharacterized protein n=1 Tax=Natronococcus jeotgali DSM 18795 TaxID=1227498 RepID=L9WWR5_9EURY|nr:hypothetical protein C492_16998 [Natronococcus jeotgali DSM 18795]